MVNYIIAGLMFGLTLFLGLTWRRRQSDILIAAAVITVSETLNIDPVYLLLDGLFPWWPNIIDVVANSLLVVGITFLSRATVRAVRGVEYRPKAPLIVMLFTLATMWVSFTFIASHASTTQLMADFGDQPAAAIYNLAQFVFIGFVMLITAWSLGRYFLRVPGLVFKLGSSLVILGCAVVLLLVGLVVVMDIAHVTHSVTVLSDIQSVYGLVDLIGMLLLCSGLTVLGLTRSPTPDPELQSLEAELAAILERAKSSADRDLITELPTFNLRGKMRRMLADVHDHVTDGTFTPTEAEWDVLRRVDERLT